jgi:hypothetical protein
MTALSDIQKALNLVRGIEKSSNADIRLDALALVTANNKHPNCLSQNQSKQLCNNLHKQHQLSPNRLQNQNV